MTLSLCRGVLGFYSKVNNTVIWHTLGFKSALATVTIHAYMTCPTNTHVHKYRQTDTQTELACCSVVHEFAWLYEPKVTKYGKTSIYGQIEDLMFGCRKEFMVQK